MKRRQREGGREEGRGNVGTARRCEMNPRTSSVELRLLLSGFFFFHYCLLGTVGHVNRAQANKKKKVSPHSSQGEGEGVPCWGGKYTTFQYLKVENADKREVGIKVW